MAKCITVGCAVGHALKVFLNLKTGAFHRLDLPQHALDVTAAPGT